MGDREKRGKEDGLSVLRQKCDILVSGNRGKRGKQGGLKAATSIFLAALLAAGAWGFLPLPDPWHRGGRCLAGTISYPPQVEEAWVADNTVFTVLPAGDVTYLGGAFRYLGPITGGGVPVNATSGTPIKPYPPVNGIVFAVVPDGSGGWIIGGSFFEVGGMTRHNLARINADGSLAPLDVQVNGPIYSLALLGEILYVGGTFSQIGGQARSSLAAINIGTGAVTDFDYGVTGGSAAVYALDLDTSFPYNPKLYVGGNFTHLGGELRNNMGAVRTVTGGVLPFNPNPNNTVRDIEVSGDGNTIYVGGYFTHIWAVNYEYVAALDNSGSAKTFNLSSNDAVEDIALSGDGNTVYVAGHFTHIGGRYQNYVASFDTAGNISSFNPELDGPVYKMLLSGNTLYMGGDFIWASGEPRRRLAAVRVTDSKLLPFQCHASRSVFDLALSGDKLYVGGYFQSLGGVARDNIAAIDALTGRATNFNPGSDGVVDDLAIDGDTLYVGGQFDYFGGQPRKNLAAVNTGSGKVTSFNPGADGWVRALALSGSTLYLGGDFTHVGGQPRNHLAAVNTGSGQVTSFNPGANDSVYSLELSKSALYLGGDFTHVGGQPRNHLAAVNTGSGQVTSFNPGGTGANSRVHDMVLSGAVLYLGGAFSLVGGQPRNRLAAVNTGTGQVLSFNPGNSGANGIVWAFALSGDLLYVGGAFTQIGGQSRYMLAAVNTATGQVTPFNPNIYAGEVLALSASGASLYAVGTFETVGVQARSKIALFRENASIWYLAEGCTYGGMQTYVLVQNPGTETAHVKLTFQTGTGEVQGPEVDLPGGRRTTFLANAFVPGNTDVSTKVTSTKPVVCERAMYGPGMSWAHDSIGITQPATLWYLAEGCTYGGMQTYVLVQNPGTETAHVKLTFQTGSGEVSGPEVDLPGGRRTTFLANAFVPNNTDVSTKVTSSKPVVCERAMYGPGMSWAHDSTGYGL
ncbi:hypothetical protein [Candidatus Solincola tengchongensis]|uniref:hypothetical protein n=1 Tax=Candidatus Solincola tengchongensis TaxID=2900693 RepID=UPI00257CE707|nr:hypothetical protein [Candidatus Solincola tengchongensis]